MSVSFTAHSQASFPRIVTSPQLPSPRTFIAMITFTTMCLSSTSEMSRGLAPHKFTPVPGVQCSGMAVRCVLTWEAFPRHPLMACVRRTKMTDQLQLALPWESIDPENSDRFEDEYAVEIPRGHPLYGVPVKAIARRVDSDDVLFRLLRHLCEFAVVHLTWSGRKESDRRWPTCDICIDVDDLMQNCIRPSVQQDDL